MPSKQEIINKILSGVWDYTYGPTSPGATRADMRQFTGSRDNRLRSGDIALPLADYLMFTPEERRQYRIADTSWIDRNRPTPRGSVERYFGYDRPRTWSEPDSLPEASAEDWAAVSPEDWADQPVVDSSPAEFGQVNFFPDTEEGMSPEFSSYETPQDINLDDIMTNNYTEYSNPPTNEAMVPTDPGLYYPANADV
jgi:hypothetical protein